MLLLPPPVQKLVFLELNKENKWNNIQPKTSIPPLDFLDIVTLCYTLSNFVFDNLHYQEINGVARGKSFAPTIANLVMDQILDTVLNTFPYKIQFVKNI